MAKVMICFHHNQLSLFPSMIEVLKWASSESTRRFYERSRRARQVLLLSVENGQLQDLSRPLFLAGVSSKIYSTLKLLQTYFCLVSNNFVDLSIKTHFWLFVYRRRLQNSAHPIHLLKCC